MGFGDFFPVSDTEVAITTVFILANIIIVANIVGGVSAIASQADVDQAANRRRLDTLERFIRSHPISADLAAAAREYLVHGMHAAADSIAAVDGLPSSICERIREERFSDVLASCSLLRGGSKLLLQQILTRVTEDIFVSGLDVVRAGTVSARLYLILEGFAQIVLRGVVADGADAGLLEKMVASDGSLVVSTLQPGACFGAEGWACSVPQPWTVRAKTLLKVISLHEADRRALEAEFPHEWCSIRTNLRRDASIVRQAASAGTKRHWQTNAELRLGLQGICWRLETTSRVPLAGLKQLAILASKVEKQIERHGARAGAALAALVCHHAGRYRLRPCSHPRASSMRVPTPPPSSVARATALLALILHLVCGSPSR